MMSNSAVLQERTPSLKTGYSNDLHNPGSFFPLLDQGGVVAILRSHLLVIVDGIGTS